MDSNRASVSWTFETRLPCRQAGFPEPKRQLTVRIDGDVIDWFKAPGKGYQTRMNAVLRAYVEAQRHVGQRR